MFPNFAKFIICLAIGLLFPSLGNTQTIYVDPSVIEGPSCIAYDSILKSNVTLAPQVSNYNVVITDGIAQIQLIQRFINPLEGLKDLVYIFPLPHKGSVHAMAMQHKGLLYKAEIFEKEEAKQIYDSVLANGGIASMLIQHQPNIFQQRLANIPKGDTALVEIMISMPLKYESGTYELAIPTMIGARYDAQIATGTITGSDPWNPPENREGPSLKINVVLQTGYPIENIESPLHPISVSELQSRRSYFEGIQMIKPEEAESMENNFGIVLEEVDTYPNRDFVLRFSRAQSSRDFSLSSYYDADKNKGFFALNLFPDMLFVEEGRPDLEIIFLVDVSGSQSGWPLEKSVEVVSEMVGRLLPTDKMAVASFENNMYWAFEPYTIVDATASNIGKAQSFLNGLTPLGGTELLAAVQKILEIPYDGNHQRLFVFTTDGFIGNVEAVLETIKNHASQPTIFTFGAGNNLNRYLLDQSAQMAGGASFELTAGDPALPSVDLAWSKFESPQLKNIELSFDPSSESELIFPRGNSLFKGSPLSVYGQYSKGGQVVVGLTGLNIGEEKSLSKTIKLADSPNWNKAVAKIWAKEKITLLEMEEGTSNTNKEEIVNISKEFQVLSEYTAFLAAKPEQVTPDNNLEDRFINYSDLEDPQQQRNKIGFSANWVNGKLNFNFSHAVAVFNWSVYDVNGKLIFKSDNLIPNLQSLSWDGVLENGSLISKGRYYLKVSTQAGQFTQSFFVR